MCIRGFIRFDGQCCLPGNNCKQPTTVITSWFWYLNCCVLIGAWEHKMWHHQLHTSERNEKHYMTFNVKKTRCTSDFNLLFSVTRMLLTTLASKMPFVAMTSQATHFQNILSLWWIVIGDCQDIVRKKKPILLIIDLSFFS